MLSRVDRMALILRIVEHLRSDPERIWEQVEFVLDGLGFDTSVGWVETNIGSGTDEQICELAQVYGVELPASVAASTTSGPVDAATVRPLFIFGSHSGAHKDLVGASENIFCRSASNSSLRTTRSSGTRFGRMHSATAWTEPTRGSSSSTKS